MRVFYSEDDDNEPKVLPRTYYVKIDNIIVPSEFRGIQAIKASSPSDLLNKIVEYYKFKLSPNVTLQLWSNHKYSMNPTRLDTLLEIPKEYEFVWIRGVSNNETY